MAGAMIVPTTPRLVPANTASDASRSAPALTPLVHRYVVTRHPQGRGCAVLYVVLAWEALSPRISAAVAVLCASGVDQM